MLVEVLVVTNPLQWSSRLRVWVLRAFGARIGANVIIRPRTRVKFPWNLAVGDNCWIGEGVWIHNQGQVTVEENVVISQESFITTGSHEFRSSMDLEVQPVVIKRGAWLTTRCIVLNGVTIGENALVTPGSVVRKHLHADNIYSGNPATIVRGRW
jgi:putative colanic acid biosynthesis acetyltransferase WcaF